MLDGARSSILRPSLVKKPQLSGKDNLPVDQKIRETFYNHQLGVCLCFKIGARRLRVRRGKMRRTQTSHPFDDVLASFLFDFFLLVRKCGRSAISPARQITSFLVLHARHPCLLQVLISPIFLFYTLDYPRLWITLMLPLGFLMIVLASNMLLASDRGWRIRRLVAISSQLQLLFAKGRRDWDLRVGFEQFH